MILMAYNLSECSCAQTFTDSAAAVAHADANPSHTITIKLKGGNPP